MPPPVGIKKYRERNTRVKTKELQSDWKHKEQRTENTEEKIYEIKEADFYVVKRRHHSRI